MTAACVLCQAVGPSHALVFCVVDRAVLCGQCDIKIHSANPVAARHRRIPACESCARASTIYCHCDQAHLCQECHASNPLSAAHQTQPAEPLPPPALAAPTVTPAGSAREGDILAAAAVPDTVSESGTNNGSDAVTGATPHAAATEGAASAAGAAPELPSFWWPVSSDAGLNGFGFGFPDDASKIQIHVSGVTPEASTLSGGGAAATGPGGEALRRSSTVDSAAGAAAAAAAALVPQLPDGADCSAAASPAAAGAAAYLGAHGDDKDAALDAAAFHAIKMEFEGGAEDGLGGAGCWGELALPGGGFDFADLLTEEAAAGPGGPERSEGSTAGVVPDLEAADAEAEGLARSAEVPRPASEFFQDLFPHNATASAAAAVKAEPVDAFDLGAADVDAAGYDFSSYTAAATAQAAPPQSRAAPPAAAAAARRKRSWHDEDDLSELEAEDDMEAPEDDSDDEWRADSDDDAEARRRKKKQASRAAKQQAGAGAKGAAAGGAPGAKAAAGAAARAAAPSGAVAAAPHPGAPPPGFTSFVGVDGANLTRAQRVARYLEKKKNRRFGKTIRYAARKAYAEIRPRIKGRFARKDEIAAWKAANGGDDAIVPECLDIVL
ncbi:hypothetical protein HXX76_005335 [Chlamydomonas incerta]|uniref:Uncharacterized protein n=1 Tax=Chlamydomonas incerta TaxID=51695 RepID=A0A835W6C1_CHLIN|nr:hypothetical protein HXX76_005335 [Chlamydomonas incerta]|eukprot:KAG2438794.1 hypothetical protein HXX76_005335 [Chlamydomonas incerta]